MRDTGWQAQEWAHKRSAKCGEAFQFLMGRRPKAAEAPSALGLMAAWTGGCAGRAGVQTLLPGGAKSSHVQRKARSGREKKVTKKFVCHHAKWRHLNIFLVTMVALVREPTAALGQCSSQSFVPGESNPWNPLSPLPAALGRLHSPWPSLPGC